MRRTGPMPTAIATDHHVEQTLESSQTSSSSRSASQSDSFDDEDSASYDLSDPLGEEPWEEIEPSESASRPRTSSYRTREAARHPPRAARRHTNDRPPTHRAPRVHRPVHRPSSSVDPDDYPGYGRGYPQPGGYGAPMPRSGYAPSSYSAGPGSGPYAPPYAAPPGALTHYGAQGGYGQQNPFSPQPHPGQPQGGAGYFSGGHHAMSAYGAPVASPYGGHEVIQYPPIPGYPSQQGMYQGCPPQGMSPHQMSPYYHQQWPHSDPPSATGDPEMEKKLIAFEEAMKNQKIDSEKAQKDLTSAWEKAQKEITARDAAEAAAKSSAEAAAIAKLKEEEERKAWETRLANEKKEAQKQGAEDARAQIEADKKKADLKAAEEKEKADAKAAVAKAEADSKAAIVKAEKERKEAIEKAEKEAKEAVDKAEKEAKEAVAKAEKEAKDAIAKAIAPVDEKKKPIKFKDAVGRKFSFPFDLCATWTGMEDLIKQAFMHVDLLGEQVAQGHYDLIGPNGEIILPQVWETMIEPDWSITMHMWPMPEPRAPGPPPNGHNHPIGRPGSRNQPRHPVGATRAPPGPPGPPQPGHRAPPPPGWPGSPMVPPGPRISSGGHGPQIQVVGAGPPKSSSSKKKSEAKGGGGVLGWLGGGKPAKPSSVMLSFAR
ncbi:hypothetical protein BJ878DRAFT_110706 [Calycina marina]|uniref:Ubiquitin-like domain-containing protein n=1 Tax=Calycina marina TaxID=1763456 RepID=A0A9P8CEE4_9HELO|nr:hypothetical protein BJ878DRAFT_110706 [Calycina marina]